MRVKPILAVIPVLISLSLSACNMNTEEHPEEHQKFIVTTPKVMDVVVTQQYVCQIHSQNHIKVRALQSGYLLKIPVNEGQTVKATDPLFKVLPIFYEARLASEEAEAKLAELELKNTERLANQNPPVVSPNEVALYRAKLAKAEAKVKLAKAELFLTEVTAPFDGMIDRLHEQQGSLVKEGDVLTTLSDNRVMWVYFNVPEARYLEYKAISRKARENQRIELVQADGKKFMQNDKVISGAIGAIDTKFNNETGTVPFRADFPNPDGVLRHGMTGNILIHRTEHNAIVIPQQATFEILDKRYVFVVDKHSKVHQREIVVENELDDVYVIKTGLGADDRIIYEGIRQVRDGDVVEFELRPVEQILKNLKHHAE